MIVKTTTENATLVGCIVQPDCLTAQPCCTLVEMGLICFPLPLEG